MRKTPSHVSVLLLLAALTMLAAPMTAGAATAKKAAVTAKSTKKVDPARSAAAKKGWANRKMREKAEANWASRNPNGGTAKAKETFINRSMGSQRAWQARKASASTNKAPKKVKKVATVKKVKKVAAAKKVKDGKKASATRNAGTKLAREQAAGKKDTSAPQDEKGMIASSTVGAHDFKTALARFDEARFALSENRNMDAAMSQMDGHDRMAQAAFDTADAYEAAGRVDEATKLRAFADEHLAKADAMEQAIGEQQAQRPHRGFASRFFHWINPFKKRGGGEQQQVAVATGQQ
jgi:hypothetical protein